MDAASMLTKEEAIAAAGDLWDEAKWEAAEKDGDMCVKLNAGFAKGYHRLANAQYLLEKYDEAMATVTEGLKKDGGFAELKKLKNKIKAKKAQKARALAGPSGGGGKT